MCEFTPIMLGHVKGAHDLISRPVGTLLDASVANCCLRTQINEEHHSFREKWLSLPIS